MMQSETVIHTKRQLTKTITRQSIRAEGPAGQGKPEMIFTAGYRISANRHGE